MISCAKNGKYDFFLLFWTRFDLYCALRYRSAKLFVWWFGDTLCESLWIELDSLFMNFPFHCYTWFKILKLFLCIDKNTKFGLNVQPSISVLDIVKKECEKNTSIQYWVRKLKDFFFQHGDTSGDIFHYTEYSTIVSRVCWSTRQRGTG